MDVHDPRDMIERTRGVCRGTAWVCRAANMGGAWMWRRVGKCLDCGTGPGMVVLTGDQVGPLSICGRRGDALRDVLAARFGLSWRATLDDDQHYVYAIGL